MMYRPPYELAQRQKRPHGKKRSPRLLPLVGVVCMLTVAGMIITGFVERHRSMALEAIEEIGAQVMHKSHKVERCRLVRSQIPPLNVHTMVYAELFNDTNSTQWAVAVKNGLKNPRMVTDPEQCDELIKIYTNPLYVVDSMYYSKPYLVPDAVIMLSYIGERFQEVMKENYPSYQHVRPIITSALRSHDDVAQLRRRNRNATDSSCHIWGTTVDIAYNRFLTDNDEYAQDLILKQMLALTLYELRYEGLIYVKYERRQACFHLTMRNPEYRGHQSSNTCRYTPPKGWKGSTVKVETPAADKSVGRETESPTVAKQAKKHTSRRNEPTQKRRQTVKPPKAHRSAPEPPTPSNSPKQAQDQPTRYVEY